jgi:hypothetical protein
MSPHCFLRRRHGKRRVSMCLFLPNFYRSARMCLAKYLLHRERGGAQPSIITHTLPGTVAKTGSDSHKQYHLPSKTFVLLLSDTPFRDFYTARITCTAYAKMKIRTFLVRNCFAIFALLSPSLSKAQCDGPLCNGLSNICGMAVNEVLFGMVHNAMSSTEAGFVFYANNVKDPFNAALDAGYRGLKLDICNCEGEFVFCHGGSNVGCGIGHRDPVSTLLRLNDWLDENPNEVVVVYLALNEAAEGPITLDDVVGIIGQVPNKFSEKLYQHNPGDAWPLLQDMISENKRILLFYDDGSGPSDVLPVGFNYFYSYGEATSDMHENVNALQNVTLGGCEVVDVSVTSTEDFLLLNNFVTGFGPFGQFMTSQSAARSVNTVEFAQPLLEACSKAHGSKVNIISVDFWELGNIPEFVLSHNRALVAPDATRCPTMMPSYLPSDEPSKAPSMVPSQTPSRGPTDSPSDKPSSLPSDKPTQIPTNMPSEVPSEVPSSMPSMQPPSSRQTVAPSQGPTKSSSTSSVQEAENRQNGGKVKDPSISEKPGKNFSNVALSVGLSIFAFIGLVSNRTCKPTYHVHESSCYKSTIVDQFLFGVVSSHGTWSRLIT